MSVVWANERDLSGRVGTSERNHDRQFIVLVQDGDNYVTALTAPGIPSVGEAHPNDSGSVCQSIRYSLPEAPFPYLYQIDAEYSSIQPDDSGNLGQDSETPPDQRLSEFETLPYSIEVLATKDAFGTQLVNSAGQLLPAEDRYVTRRILMVRYTRWYSANDFNPLTAPVDWVDHVNSGTWTIAPGVGLPSGATISEAYAKIDDVRAIREFWQGQLYYRVEFQILVRSQNDSLLGDWRTKIPDRGKTGHEVIGGVDNWYTFTDYDQGSGDIRRPVREPVLMDGTGGRLDPGLDPVELDFFMFRTLDFASIGLR